MAAALVASCALAGCGDRSGSALVDSSTTTMAAAASTAGTPGRSTRAAAPTTGAIPSTTGAVPLTTAEMGPAGQVLTFRRMTLRLRDSWRAGGGGDLVAVAASRACRRSAGGVDCPGFLLLGPTQIAIADELSPYDPERAWHPGAGVEGCPADRDGLAELTPSRPSRRGVVKVGGRNATYREWRITCVDVKTGKPEAGYVQRVWHLPASRILIVDEWSTPGLGQVLAAASFG